MSNKVLAVDDISIKPKKYAVGASSYTEGRGTTYSFDINFSIETDNGKESTAVIRLTDEQAKKLILLLDDRYKDENN